MIYAIVGSRDFPNAYQRVYAYIVSHVPVDGTIVTGGARGVDEIAERIQKERGGAVRVFPAEWNKYGKGAGYIRNRDIVGAADKVVAFWDGTSKGTKHSIDLALYEFKKDLEVIFP